MFFYSNNPLETARVLIKIARIQVKLFPIWRNQTPCSFQFWGGLKYGRTKVGQEEKYFNLHHDNGRSQSPGNRPCFQSSPTRKEGRTNARSRFFVALRPAHRNSGKLLSVRRQRVPSFPGTC